LLADWEKQFAMAFVLLQSMRVLRFRRDLEDKKGPIELGELTRRSRISE